MACLEMLELVNWVSCVVWSDVGGTWWTSGRREGSYR